MGDVSFNLGVIDANKIKMIKKIQDSLAVAKVKKAETGYFDNGHDIRKWGYIYEELSKGEIEDLLTFNTKRRSWKLPFKIDSTNNTLYCLLSKNNLDIKQKGKSKVIHYVSAISSVYNHDFENKLSEDQKKEVQLKMDLGFDKEDAEKICEEMLGELAWSINQFCVITLDIVRYELIGVQANILNQSFDILYTEDWSRHIRMSSSDENDAEQRVPESTQHDMKVQLKSHRRKEQQE